MSNKFLQAALAYSLLVFLLLFTHYNVQAETNFTHQHAKILPLGDSITQGNRSHASYRRQLWFKLQHAGYNVDFVGSLWSYIDSNLQDFDLDHEGHGGWTSWELESGLNAWLQSYTPDIVLLHAGTNDILQGQSTARSIESLTGIINQLRANNPEVIILLAKIIPVAYIDISGFNAEIESLVQRLNNRVSPIILVDQYTGFNVGQDTYDTVHPNTSGEEKMAQKWFAALAPFFEPDNRNQAPEVNAGANQHVNAPNLELRLNGTVKDDGLPLESRLTTVWTKQSGSGNVIFKEATNPNTIATFTEEGVYTLRLTADDSILSANDDVTVIVGQTDEIEGLVGHWKLDENSGTQVIDASGHGYNGTLLSAATHENWVSGQLGGALSLDGKRETVEVKNAQQLTPQSMTLSAWVLVDPSITDWAWVMGHGDNYGLVANPFNNKGLAFYFYNGENWVSVITEDPTKVNILDDQWHHIAATFDEKSGTLRLYFDSVEVAIRTSNKQIVYELGNTFRIGSMQGQRLYTGLIDDVQVYNRALDATELAIISQNKYQTTNLPPTVNAGADLNQIAIGERVQLSAKISDDGLPEHVPLSILWQKREGTGEVVLDDPNQAETGVRFFAEGEYILRLTVSDSLETISDEIKIKVTR